MIRAAPDELSNLVSHTAVRGKAFFLGVGIGRQTWRIIKADMNDLGLAEENRAVLVSMAANGYDVIEGDVPKLSDVLGSLAGNIDARIGHDTDCIGVQSVRFDPSGIRFDGIALEFMCPSLGHLAAAGISRAEKKNLRLVRSLESPIILTVRLVSRR